MLNSGNDNTRFNTRATNIWKFKARHRTQYNNKHGSTGNDKTEIKNTGDEHNETNQILSTGNEHNEDIKMLKAQTTKQLKKMKLRIRAKKTMQFQIRAMTTMKTKKL